MRKQPITNRQRTTTPRPCWRPTGLGSGVVHRRRLAAVATSDNIEQRPRRVGLLVLLIVLAAFFAVAAVGDEAADRGQSARTTAEARRERAARLREERMAATFRRMLAREAEGQSGRPREPVGGEAGR